MKKFFLWKLLKFMHVHATRLRINLENAVWFVLYSIFLKSKGIEDLKAYSFFSWHHSTIYFSGKYSGNKVFLKCEVGFKNYLINELKIYQILSENFESKKVIPDLVDTFNWSLGFCIVYKFLNAPNLQEYFNDGKKFKNDEHSNEILVSKLINIVDCLERINIIHRDFRPANIFVDQDKLIIFDFAFAVWLNSDEQSSPKNVLEKSLGEHYKPEESKWDDAYSLSVIVKENNFSLSEEMLKEVDKRVNRLTYSR